MGLYYHPEWAPNGYEKQSGHLWIHWNSLKPEKQLEVGRILITKNELHCKKDVSEKLNGFVEVISEKSNFVVWLYRPTEAYLLNEVNHVIT